MTENEHLEYIKELLAYDIPEFTPPEDGFLEIAGLSHYENINSKIYAYFLNRQKEPEIAEKFLTALFDLIKQKKVDKIISIDDFDVSTEYATKKGRIDILIRDKENESAIIIENKIFHYLNNPLEEYFDFIEGETENKVGVLLTLHQLSPKELESLDKNYINITHKEWVDKIKALGLPANLNPKKYIYLNDFFQTINNLTTEINMNELAKFYFNHTEKVNSALNALHEAQKFVANQLEILAQTLNLTLFGKTYVWRSVLNNDNYNNICYTIYFEPIFTSEKNISISITLEGDKLEKKSTLLALIREDLLKDKKLDTNKGANFCHFITKYYTLNNDEIETLSSTLKKYIDNDFEPIMEIINPQLIQNKK